MIELLAMVPAREVEEFVYELARRPEGWWAVGAFALTIAMLAAVVWMYRHEGRIGSSVGMRTALAALRCVVLLLLAIILLEPVRVRVLRRWVDSYTLVLVDDSASMDLRDVYRNEDDRQRVHTVLGEEPTGEVSRRDVARAILANRDRAWLRGLAQNNRVKVLAFADEPTLVATIGSSGAGGRAAATGRPNDTVENAPIDLNAAGKSTNVERAIRRAVESVGTAPVAGVVVLSDGGFNDGASSDEVARFARERRLPVHTVGIGDPSPPRNVRIAEVDIPDTAFQRDPFPIEVQLAAEGLAGESIQVELRERAGEGADAGRLVETRSVGVTVDNLVPRVRFERRPPAVGRYVYTIEATPVVGESVVDDNRRQAAVNVIDSRTRVLLISGLASWEYRFLTTLLLRDETFDLSCWLQSADTTAVRDGVTVIDHLPATEEELFAYDVIVLLDPDHAELSEAWGRLVDTLVTEHGGGLLVGAARPHTPEFMRDASTKPLRELLPVVIDPEADLVLNRLGHYQSTPLPLDVPQAALTHPVLRLADDPGSTRVLWQGIGDIFWHYPVLREKPAATVLLRHGDPRMRNSYGGHVLLATQFVGAGRSAYLAFDGTWRWRKYGEEVYNRFWVQLIRHLAEGKRFGGTRRGELLTEGEEFSLGDAIRVNARLLDARYQPLARDSVAVQYSLEGERGEITLQAQRDRPGWYEGRLVPDRAGSCRLTLPIPTESRDAAKRGSDAAELVRDIRVTRPNIEVRRTQMDEVALRSLAEQSFGGRFWRVDEAAQLPTELPDLHEEIPVRSRPKPLWDNGFALTALLVLLSMEWAVRKWRHLL